MRLFCEEFSVDLSKAGADWDRELTQAEFFKLRPEFKGERTRLSFVRKINLMIDMMDDSELRDAIPKEEYATRTALRRWSDTGRKLWPWSFPAIDSPDGDYHKLHSIYEETELALDAIRKGKKFSLLKQVDEKDRIIERLESQILDLMDQINRLMNNAGQSPKKR